MQLNKERSAEESYKKFLDIMLYDVPLNQLDELVVNDVTGYGTTLDEKILEIERLRKIVIDQREQGAGYEINFVVNPVHRRINTDNGLAVFIDEIEITMSINGNKNIIPLRFSSVLELINGSWKVVHLHGSVAVNTEGDTWHKEEHLRKIEELEKLVSEKTEDLVIKNRELEIETALEKVRSSALTMKQPAEMLDVCRIISNQLLFLGVKEIRNVQTAIIYESKGTYLNYEFYVKHNKALITEVDFSIHHLQELFVKQMLNGTGELFTRTLKGNEVKDWYEHQKTTNQFADTYLETAKSLTYYWYSLGPVALGISTYEPLSDEEIKLFKRFRNVFELAYQRFLDIEQALAQAREAEIELALERVRARTMAMQKSEELKEVIRVVYEQFVHLKINVDHAGFVVDYKPKGDWYFWIADERDIPSKITHPYFDSIWANQFNEAKEKGLNFFTTNLNFNEKNKFYNELLSYVPGLPQASKDFYLSCPGLAATTVLMENVGLYIENFSGTPYSDEENNTLIRFGKVFQQTYTRILDLQRAEAQAREAQIENALEKVRSRSLAMHKSDELGDLSFELVKQVQALGIETWFCAFNIYEDHPEGSLEWGSNAEGTYKEYRTPREGIFLRYWEAGQRGESLIINEINENECPGHYEYLCSLPGVGEQLLQMKDAGISFPTSQIDHIAYFKYGYIIFITFASVPEAHDIFKRFAKVFEQSYTRFLDLKKAETQAREAKIEAALEKVRSKTMAMQSSDELADTAAVVFQQLINLEIEPNRIYITIIKDEKGTCEFWITDEDGSKVSSVFRTNLNENTSFKKMYSGWKENKKSITIDMEGEELQHYFKHLSSLNVPFKGGLVQKRRLQYIAYFSKGFIGVASPDETKPETIPLLERFAAVFNLTYTRFNDLQQAEAQNKIIQAENDRKSKELEDARQLQLGMLPRELPKIPNLDIAVYMKTATEVGGDYYDFNVDNNGTLTFIVGDATGHGMMSGMMVSIMKSFFIADRNKIELKQFFENANNSIKDMQLGRLMMALVGIQITSEKIIATNAGMPSLLYFRNKSQKAGEFVSHNLPLGGMKNTNYMLKEIRYEKGDTLLLMSDGFAELKNDKNEQYGYDRVKKEFMSVAQKSSNEIIEHLNNSASKWIDGIEPDDDVTFVVIKVK